MQKPNTNIYMNREFVALSGFEPLRLCRKRQRICEFITLNTMEIDSYSCHPVQCLPSLGSALFLDYNQIRSNSFNFCQLLIYYFILVFFHRFIRSSRNKRKRYTSTVNIRIGLNLDVFWLKASKKRNSNLE